MENLASKLEALLFSYAEPLSYKKIINVLNTDFEELKKAAGELAQRYNSCSSSLELIELNLSYQIVVRSEYGELLDELFKNDSKKGLTQSQLEVLSVVAYRQPVTKRDIERIRGIKSDRVVNSLIELELIRITGKKEAPGLPALYSTTDSFLRLFGIKTLSELPKLTNVENLSLFDK